MLLLLPQLLLLLLLLQVWQPLQLYIWQLGQCCQQCVTQGVDLGG
jgi:hypothetical protein